jgi:hypothetical protein
MTAKPLPSGDDDISRLIITVISASESPPDWVVYETGLVGYWDGGDFIVPIRDATTLEEVSRIVAQAIKRAGETNGTK